MPAVLMPSFSFSVGYTVCKFKRGNSRIARGAGVSVMYMEQSSYCTAWDPSELGFASLPLELLPQVRFLVLKKSNIPAHIYCIYQALHIVM
jgi:hypothetical protein